MTMSTVWVFTSSKSNAVVIWCSKNIRMTKFSTSDRRGGARATQVGYLLTTSDGTCARTRTSTYNNTQQQSTITKCNNNRSLSTYSIAARRCAFGNNTAYSSRLKYLRLCCPRQSHTFRSDSGSGASALAAPPSALISPQTPDRPC